MRPTHLLALFAALALTAMVNARQSSLRTYDIPFDESQPFVGEWAGGVSIPSIGKHGFSGLEVFSDPKGNLDAYLTLAPFRMFRQRCGKTEAVADTLKFTLPPPPRCTSAECVLTISDDAQRLEGMIHYYPEVAEYPPARVVVVRRPSLLSMQTVRSWTGLIDQEGAPLELTIRVGTHEQDALTVGEFDIPEHQYYGAKLGNLQYDPDAGYLIASIPEFINGILDLEVLEDGHRLKGTYTRDRTVSPAEFTSDPIIHTPRSFRNEAGGQSFGEFTMPVGDGPFPCIVILGTFGVNDRNGVNSDTGSHQPYKILSDALAEAGYAVYRYDDRGTGMSRTTPPSTTLGSTAADAAGAIALVANTPRIDPEKIILLGHGEGGMIAPMLLNRTPSPAGLILINAPVGKGADYIVEKTILEMSNLGRDRSRIEARTYLIGNFLEAVSRGMSDEELEGIIRSHFIDYRSRVPEQNRASLPSLDDAIRQDMASLANPWMRSVASWDNATALANADIPVLALFAEDDPQVPASPAEARAKLAFNTGGTNAKVITLPGLAHYMQRDDADRTPFDAKALEAVSNWLAEHFPVR